MPGDVASIALVLMGVAAFLAGAAGLVRFPDTYSRLHALTKADNLGLALIALGVALQADGLAEVLKLALIWMLALLAAGTASQLVARSALEHPEQDGEDEP